MNYLYGEFENYPFNKVIGNNYQDNYNQILSYSQEINENKSTREDSYNYKLENSNNCDDSYCDDDINEIFNNIDNYEIQQIFHNSCMIQEKEPMKEDKEQEFLSKKKSRKYRKKKEDLIKESDSLKDTNESNSEKKKLGRKPKGEITEENSSKFRLDNIQRKLKNNRLEAIRLIMNKNLQAEHTILGLPDNCCLHKIEEKFGKDISIVNNILQREKNLFEIFSKPQTKHLVNDNNNKEIIEAIKLHPESRVFKMASVKWGQWNDIWLNVNECMKYGIDINWLDGFDCLNKVCEKLENKSNSEDYINKYREAAKNYENYFDSKREKSRKLRETEKESIQ